MFRELNAKIWFRQDIGGKAIKEFLLSPAKNESFDLCVLKGLLKVHKGKPYRMRLVFPMHNHPTGPLHVLIGKCLQPWIMRFPFLFKPNLCTKLPEHLVSDVVQVVLRTFKNFKGFRGSIQFFFQEVDVFFFFENDKSKVFIGRDD